MFRQPTARYVAYPPRFWYFLQDALLTQGLPYGPQAREHLAQSYPDLFGRSSATLRGYDKWLVRTSRPDSSEAFAAYMEQRYNRWVAVAPAA
jgi:hypothetical protein